MTRIAAEDLLRDFEDRFGFRPKMERDELGKVQHGLEQTIVNNELANQRHLLSRAQGDSARVLRVQLENMIKSARMLGFKTEL